MSTDKKVIVNYCQHWNEEGTHYTQTITIDKSFIKYINKQIKKYHESTAENKNILSGYVGFSTYYDFYLKEIDTTKDKYFLNITQLHFIYYYLNINRYDTRRIKERNTLLLMK